MACSSTHMFEEEVVVCGFGISPSGIGEEGCSQQRARTRENMEFVGD